MPGDISKDDLPKQTVRSQSKSEYQMKNTISLEKFIYYMFINPEKCFDIELTGIQTIKDKSIYGTHFNFKARNESNYYRLTLFIYMD